MDRGPMSQRARLMSPRGARSGMVPLHKENDPADAQASRRQRTAAGPGRQLLSATAPPEEEPMVLAGREDVEALLGEKMEGKNKLKTEGMTEYIKKLQICIKWLLDREDEHLAQGKLNSETVAKLTGTLNEAKSVHRQLHIRYDSLQEMLKKVEAEKMEALRALQDEKKARASVESSQNQLLENLKRRNDQEYNTRFQPSFNLQAGASQLPATSHSYSLRSLNLSSQTEAAKQKNDLLKEVEGLRMELQHVREDRDNKSSEVDSLMAEIRTFKESIWKTAMEVDDIITRTTALEKTCSSQRETIKTLEIKLEAAREKLKRPDLTALETMKKYENQKKMLENLQSRLQEAEHQILDGEKLRKKLHNEIIELKGNIRVFCRVRPLMSNESGAISYPKSGENIGRGIELMHNAQPYSFTFDKVFDHSASQDHVFIEISQLVQSALDGYKVCIFAYGQTGSGKTYTMMGNPELDDQKGMIPKSLEQIFQASQALNSQGWKYKMQASMLEIYNETIRDLLAVNRMAAQDGAASKYTIMHDARGNTFVSDLMVVDVTSIMEISSLLRQAAQSR